MATYLVEHYWPGVTVESFRAAAERVRLAAGAMTREGGSIRLLHSTLVPADEAAFCACEATSKELVEQAYARAGVRFERLVETVELRAHGSGEEAERRRPVGPAARAELAAAADMVDPVLVQRVLRDPDADVRQAARRAQGHLRARPRPPLRIVTLGGFSVWRGDVLMLDAAFKRSKGRVLLAALACAGEPVHREILLEWLWPHLSPSGALASLHSTLYVLRRLVEPGLARGAQASVIVTDGQAYRLVLSEQDEWDAARFLCLAEAGCEPGPAATRVDQLLAAEACYVGRFLPEWPYEEWAARRRAEVERAYRAVLEQLAAALLEAGPAAAAIGRLERLLELEPERESYHRALMQTYAQAGERALALRQYHACRTVLREQMGVEPSAETRALHGALL